MSETSSARLLKALYETRTAGSTAGLFLPLIRHEVSSLRYRLRFCVGRE
jgi:hypothetical protein